MSAEEELDKLKKLRVAGTITDEQYERATAKLFAEEPALRDETRAPEYETARADARERHDEEDRPLPRRRRYEEDGSPRKSRAEVRRETRQWSMFLHLSSVLWIVGPVVIWQVKKNELPGIDVHGKNAVNWLISYVIYLAISFALCFVFVGFLLLPVVAVLGVVFPVVAAVKANEGEVWEYPLAFPFVR